MNKKLTVAHVYTIWADVEHNTLSPLNCDEFQTRLFKISGCFQFVRILPDLILQQPWLHFNCQNIF